MLDFEKLAEKLAKGDGPKEDPNIFIAQVKDWFSLVCLPPHQYIYLCAWCYSLTDAVWCIQAVTQASTLDPSDPVASEQPDELQSAVAEGQAIAEDLAIASGGYFDEDTGDFSWSQAVAEVDGFMENPDSCISISTPTHALAPAPTPTPTTAAMDAADTAGAAAARALRDASSADAAAEEGSTGPPAAAATALATEKVEEYVKAVAEAFVSAAGGTSEILHDDSSPIGSQVPREESRSPEITPLIWACVYCTYEHRAPAEEEWLACGICGKARGVRTANPTSPKVRKLELKQQGLFGWSYVPKKKITMP